MNSCSNSVTHLQYQFMFQYCHFCTWSVPVPTLLLLCMTSSLFRLYQSCAWPVHCSNSYHSCAWSVHCSDCTTPVHDQFIVPTVPLLCMISSLFQLYQSCAWSVHCSNCTSPVHDQFIVPTVPLLCMISSLFRLYQSCAWSVHCSNSYHSCAWSVHCSSSTTPVHDQFIVPTVPLLCINGLYCSNTTCPVHDPFVFQHYHCWFIISSFCSNTVTPVDQFIFHLYHSHASLCSPGQHCPII